MKWNKTEYKQSLAKLETKEIYNEILSHVAGDDWDGFMSTRCVRELEVLQEEFKERMEALGVEWII